MSDENFESTLSALSKPQETKVLLKLLAVIRKGVEWPSNKDQVVELRVKGYLKQLISILQMSNKHILDLCLSILGNCTLEEGCARDSVSFFSF